MYKLAHKKVLICHQLKIFGQGIHFKKTITTSTQNMFRTDHETEYIRQEAGVTYHDKEDSAA